MMDYNVNSTETLYNNSLILDARLKRLEQMMKEIDTKENNYIYSTYVLGAYTMFINNFRSIYIKLNEIETAISFSKVSVLHQSIVNSTELFCILSCIEKVHSLIYPVSKGNLLKLEQTLSVKAYTKGNQITFIMEVPLTDNVTYNYYKIYSLPMYNPITDVTSIIIPEYPFLMVKGLKYLPVTSPCLQISANDQYICTEDTIAQYSTVTCMEQLMQFHTNLSHCSQKAVQLEDLRVQRLSPDRWIIYSQRNAIMSYKCGNDITRTTVCGTYLIQIEQDCEVLLGDFHLYYFPHSLETFNYRVTPVIDLPDVKVKDTTAFDVIDIKGVNLDEMKYLSAVLKTKREGESYSEPIKVKSVSLWTMLLYLILIIIGLFIIVKKLKRCVKDRNPQNPKSSDGSELKEGGVMLPTNTYRLQRVTVNP